MIRKALFSAAVNMALILAGEAALHAQSRMPDSLTLQDIYKNGTYRQLGFGPVRWMKDNLGYSSVETDSVSGGQDIVRYDVHTGARTILVSSKLLVPPGSDRPLPIADYQWSDDNKKLLIFTNTRRVWRYNTRGDYWVLDLTTRVLQQLGKTVERTTMMFAKFNPAATKVAYVSKQNIYVEDLASGDILQLTKDGGDNIIDGTFDWVYEEELDCRDGFRWSPDGNTIAYWQTDTKGTGVFYLIDNVDSIYSRPIPFPYPKVGTTLSSVRVGIIPATGGTTRWLDLPGDPRNHYIARMDFIPHSDDLLIQQLNRIQDSNVVWVANAQTLKLDNILTDSDSAFLDLHDNIEWLDGDKYFTWTSERDGWLHLYKVSRDGRDIQLITKGNFDVVNIDCIDPVGGYVYYIASPHNYTDRFLYRSRLDGYGEAERVTPTGPAFDGEHSYQMSADARYAIHTFQNTTTPPVISLISLPNHRTLKVLQDNHVLKVQYDHLRLNPKHFFRVDLGDVTLDAWMIKPPHFDSTKKYPVIFYVYGEPAGSTVQNDFEGGDLWSHYLAQEGYVVMSVDNRGTKAPRGRAWRKSIYRQIGILASRDQSRAALTIESMFPFVDRSRIGIWGWSGGGQMTLNCLFRYPKIYKAGLAVSFVSDQRLYDATYQERYMGLPRDNPDGYRDGSPINYAKYLEGNLMIIHGTGDDNVHYQNFEMLVNELIKDNKMFNMMSYPMRSHGIFERENTSLHLRETMIRFWRGNL